MPRRPVIAAAPSWLPAQLRAAGYTTDSLQRSLRATSPDDVGVLNYASAAARVAGDRSAAAVLIRLLFLEEKETWRAVARALSPRRCEELVAVRLLSRRGGTVRARVRIDPVGNWYVAADRRFRAVDRAALGLPAGDEVYPPSSDSLLLRDAIVASEAHEALDLCTGSGVQALQVAAKVARVTAVDINPRAVALAQFNARLNGVPRLDTRVGDLYAPVRGRQFDLVIANPPFVASPYASAPSYHAGGPTGDRVLRRIIDGLRNHLRPRGQAFVISHVALRQGETMGAVARRWFRGFPGRALILVLETGSPIDLAAAQSLFALERGLRAYASELQRWLDYLRRHRIYSVSLLLIAAELGTQQSIEVVDAPSRVLPIPLGPPPVERITKWLG